MNEIHLIILPNSAQNIANNRLILETHRKLILTTDNKLSPQIITIVTNLTDFGYHCVALLHAYCSIKECVLMSEKSIFEGIKAIISINDCCYGY